MTEKITSIFDVECYRNYFLVKFRRADTGAMRDFEMYEDHPLDIEGIKVALRSFTLVSFNGRNYDMPMIALACTGATTQKLKEASDAIIVGGLKPWEFEDRYCIKIPSVDHIDLIEVAPGQASLKLYGGRLHSRKLQDLPIEPDALITPADRTKLRLYCGNDLVTTDDLRRKMAPQIELRERMSKEYGMDLRSKSDAQIAEAVIRSKVSDLLGFKVTRPEVAVGRTFRYRPPAFLTFLTPVMQATFEMVKQSAFVVEASGKVLMPKALADAKIKIGDSIYRMGVGGLHSSEQTAAHFADDDTILVDRDVASYYPAIILNTGLAPQHMGGHFTKVYKDIVAKRLEAKRAGNKVTADALKITINGSFGKFGSKWSTLYSPDLLVQTTVGGQLALLMLIEALHAWEIPVVSANTDGIVIKCPKHLQDAMDLCVSIWERRTGFETEATHYTALYSRDVNNYIAVKPDGEVKTKGAYASPGLQKNPANEICAEAVIANLTWGFPVEDWIHGCDDVRKFVTVRRVTGGATWCGQFVGKTVRWIYTTAGGEAMHYCKPNKTGGYNKVAKTDGCRPLMELTDEVPADLDRAWYIAEANDILKDIGAIQ